MFSLCGFTSRSYIKIIINWLFFLLRSIVIKQPNIQQQQQIDFKLCPVYYPSVVSDNNCPSMTDGMKIVSKLCHQLTETLLQWSCTNLKTVLFRHIQKHAMVISSSQKSIETKANNSGNNSITLFALEHHLQFYTELCRSQRFCVGFRSGESASSSAWGSAVSSIRFLMMWPQWDGALSSIKMKLGLCSCSHNDSCSMGLSPYHSQSVWQLFGLCKNSTCLIFIFIYDYAPAHRGHIIRERLLETEDKIGCNKRSAIKVCYTRAYLSIWVNKEF